MLYYVVMEQQVHPGPSPQRPRWPQRGRSQMALLWRSLQEQTLFLRLSQFPLQGMKHLWLTGLEEVIRQQEEAGRREVEEREGKERWDKIKHKIKSSKEKKESQEIKKRRYWNFANHFLSQLCLLDLETGAWLTEVKYHCNLNSHLAGIYFSHVAVHMHRFSD